MDDTTQVSGNPEPTALDLVANPVEGNLSQATAAEGEGDQPQEQVEQLEQKNAPPKTFTQEEVDALIQKRLTKEARRQERLMAQRLAEVQAAQAKPQPQGEKQGEGEPPAQMTAEQVIEAAKRLAPQFAQQQREQERQQQALEQFWERADEVAERFPDFDTTVRDPSFTEMQGAVYEFVMDSELGPELAYHLAKNRAQARAIARMSPMQAAKALFALEGELKAKPKAQPSKAPDPINPVGNRGAAARSSAPSDEDDVDTWMRKRTEQLKTRRR